MCIRDRIRTPHDTFTAARLINQSIPVKYFMSKENLVSFRLNDYVEDVKEVMAKRKFRDFPVIDKKGRFYGFISRRRLMGSRKKQVILVDHNEKSQAVDGIEEAEILEIIDHHLSLIHILSGQEERKLSEQSLELTVMTQVRLFLRESQLRETPGMSSSRGLPWCRKTEAGRDLLKR